VGARVTDRPGVLIEQWFPIAELGVESRREREVVSGIPDLFALHLWWARRPLVASAGLILGSVLPAWSPAVPDIAPEDPRLSTESEYRRWFLALCGILGDPVGAKARIEDLKSKGKKPRELDHYGYLRAFHNTPNRANLDLLQRVLEATWGEIPRVIDPTAGGGSIPYSAARLRLPVIANDLNAVACAVLRAGIEATAAADDELLEDLSRWGEVLVERCASEAAEYFPQTAGERIAGYLWARTMPCPRTGKQTPLAPKWWLVKKAGAEVAVGPVTHRSGVELDEVEFDILYGSEAVESKPDDGTAAGGHLRSVWDGLAIDVEDAKSAFREGRGGVCLYAVATRATTRGGPRKFRRPTRKESEAIAHAATVVESRLAEWKQDGVVPSESIPPLIPKHDITPYGITEWSDFFTARQLLVHAIFVSEFVKLQKEVFDEIGESRGRTVMGILGLMQGKALNYNSVCTFWDYTAGKVTQTFTRHDFAFRWSFAEADGAGFLWAWALERLLANFRAISALYEPGRLPYAARDSNFLDSDEPVGPPSVAVVRGTAGDLTAVGSGSQSLVCIDPPYYDNVMYGELSDFFGVWEQHTVGSVWPDLMPGGLADQANEAVANVARFESFGRRKKELASADYQAKMRSVFAECNRVLRDDGVLSVMFTHKKAEAWDTLGMALMEAGFEIATSWPVNTESKQSLNIAKKNAAESTVMLVCRKRSDRDTGPVFFEELVHSVKSAAREAVERFESHGIEGVDLLLSTYGPVLSVISAAWPVYSSDANADGSARLIQPEEALNVARAELVEARRLAIVGRQVTFDSVTDFWLIAWELFRAEEFPYDEARRLALAVGGQDPESLAAVGILRKKTGTVVLTTPGDRRRRVLRPVQDGEFEDLALVDILHGVLVVSDLDGLAAAKTLMDRHSLTVDPRFLALVQGAVNAVPRTKKKGVFVRPEAAALDALVTAYLPSVTIPEDEPPDTLFDID